jgi:hypothetical protein
MEKSNLQSLRTQAKEVKVGVSKETELLKLALRKNEQKFQSVMVVSARSSN